MLMLRLEINSVEEFNSNILNYINGEWVNNYMRENNINYQSGGDRSGMACIININNDLDFAGKSIPYINTDQKMTAFNVYINGNGNTISNMKASTGGERKTDAIFDILSINFTIMNINFVNLRSTLVGIHYGTIRNCSFKSSYFEYQDEHPRTLCVYACMEYSILTLCIFEDIRVEANKDFGLVCYHLINGTLSSIYLNNIILNAAQPDRTEIVTRYPSLSAFVRYASHVKFDQCSLNNVTINNSISDKSSSIFVGSLYNPELYSSDKNMPFSEEINISFTREGTGDVFDNYLRAYESNLLLLFRNINCNNIKINNNSILIGEIPKSIIKNNSITLMINICNLNIIDGVPYKFFNFEYKDANEKKIDITNIITNVSRPYINYIYNEEPAYLDINDIVIGKVTFKQTKKISNEPPGGTYPVDY